MQCVSRDASRVDNLDSSLTGLVLCSTTHQPALLPVQYTNLPCFLFPCLPVCQAACLPTCLPASMSYWPEYSAYEWYPKRQNNIHNKFLHQSMVGFDRLTLSRTVNSQVRHVVYIIMFRCWDSGCVLWWREGGRGPGLVWPRGGLTFSVTHLQLSPRHTCYPHTTLSGIWKGMNYMYWNDTSSAKENWNRICKKSLK